MSQPPYQQQPGYYQPYQPPQNHGSAVTSLVLGIVSLVFCGFVTGIPAIVVGRRAKREIQASGGRLGGEGLATAGVITGIIGSILSLLGVLIVVAVFVFGGVLASSFESTCTTTNSSGGSTTTDC